MAKKSSVLKNDRRKALTAKYATRRQELKATIKNPATSWEDRQAAQLKLAKLPRDSNGIRVTPIVNADKSMSGEYSLTITKIGRAGSSDISQGGPFDASRGERVRLSSSEFSMERGAKFRAVLEVRAGGREVCRDVRS